MSPEHRVGQPAFVLLHESHSHRIILQELKHLLRRREFLLKFLKHVKIQSTIPALHRLLSPCGAISAIRGVLLLCNLLSLLFLVVIRGI
jgi:hypothetical protein